MYHIVGNHINSKHKLCMFSENVFPCISQTYQGQTLPGLYQYLPPTEIESMITRTKTDGEEN